MDLILNVHGEIIEPNLHDGYAESLAVDRENKSAVLKCVSEDGKAVAFRFAGILAFEGNNFKEGNIINEITILRGAAIPESVIKHLLFNPSSKAIDVLKTTEELQKSAMMFFHLIPSYGLEIKIICKSVSI